MPGKLHVRWIGKPFAGLFVEILHRHHPGAELRAIRQLDLGHRRNVKGLAPQQLNGDHFLGVVMTGHPVIPRRSKRAQARTAGRHTQLALERTQEVGGAG
ncbi:hypothetical protein D3C72_1204590 [compost metagenome]